MKPSNENMSHGKALSMRMFTWFRDESIWYDFGMYAKKLNGLQWSIGGFLVWVYGFGVDLALKLALQLYFKD